MACRVPTNRSDAHTPLRGGWKESACVLRASVPSRVESSFALRLKRVVFALEAFALVPVRLGVRAESLHVVGAGAAKSADARAPHAHAHCAMQERKSPVMHAEQSVAAMTGAAAFLGAAARRADTCNDKDRGRIPQRL